MVKPKKSARSGGKPRGKTSHDQPGTLSNAFVRSSLNRRPSSDHETADPFISLRDTARNTDHHRTSWGNADQNLRSRSVGFVRGSDPLKGTLENYDKLPPTKRHLTSESSDPSQPALVSSAPTSAHSAQPPPRVPSPSLSDSSEEVIIFAGRHRSPSICPSIFPHNVHKDPVAPKSYEIAANKDLQSRHSQRVTELPRQSPTPRIDRHIPKSNTSKDSEPESSLHKQPPHGQRRSGKKQNVYSRLSQSDSGDSDAILADYMDNMRAYGELDDDFVFQAQGSDMDVDGWGVSELADFDDLSTSAEVADTLGSILAKRVRDSGLQYLVVWQGQSADEARWIQRESLSMDGAQKIIDAFEKQEMQKKLVSDTSNEGDNSLDDHYELDDGEASSDPDEDFEDERDLVKRRMARMTDEQIARLLSKQEQLGMGSHELLLFDALGDVHTGDQVAEDDDFIPLNSSSRVGKAKSMQRKPARSPFEPFLGPSNDLLGDDCGDFDVSFGLSDSGLEAGLREQFAADRKKKKLKRQQREELRAQGLLGKKNKFEPDLSARYNDGLSMSQFKDELENFLFSGNENLALPPMGKRERKIIHEISSQFNLKSKSIGSGKLRFPVLYKTLRTIDFDATLFKRAETRSQRGFLPRMDTRGKGKSRLPSGRSGGGGIISGTGYAEGETVGATAPELGLDNRGRAMLEKMGWSTGMALGTQENKGILQPIPHVVRKTRAGLG